VLETLEMKYPKRTLTGAEARKILTDMANPPYLPYETVESKGLDYL
jgi:hypothetical protein